MMEVYSNVQHIQLANGVDSRADY